jgi:hypothetical protein
LSRERQSYEDQEGIPSGRGASGLLAAETLRNCADGPPAQAPRGEERISVFWRVFGGTILSIAALAILTVYNQFAGTLTDLRKEVNQLYENRAELLRKDEFNNRLTSVWSGLKDLQSANQNLAALNERARLVDQQFERQLKSADDDRKELVRKLEEQRRSFEQDRKELVRQIRALSERLAKIEARKVKASAAKK